MDGLQYASMLRNLEEREEGERERKVASDYELNFRYFNADAFEVFVKMNKLAFGSKSSMLRNNLTMSRCYFLEIYYEQSPICWIQTREIFG
nr:hypothetical protein CFP56_17130 [Quercus suber]